MGNLARTNAEILTERVENAVTQLHKHSLGQHGSAFTDDNANTVTPPAGKVIVAVQFLGTVRLAALTAEGTSGSESFAIGSTGAGSGGLAVDNSNKFASGSMIFGRWTAVQPHTTVTSGHGVICYFGY